jgi:hypothetical protein
MRVNFLITDCKEPSRSENLFGICDDQNGKAAYTENINPEKWIAKVINEENIQVSFTAIDNCIMIFKEGSKDKESTCDGMLTFDKSIYLVELKVQRTGGWIPEAILQLENTIKLLQSNHTLNEFSYKKAFACNRKHPNFRTMDNEFRKRFFQRTKGFRIDIQAEIKIK